MTLKQIKANLKLLVWMELRNKKGETVEWLAEIEVFNSMIEYGVYQNGDEFITTVFNKGRNIYRTSSKDLELAKTAAFDHYASKVLELFNPEK